MFGLRELLSFFDFITRILDLIGLERMSIGVNRCCISKKPCFFLMSHISHSKSRGPFRALGQDGSSPVRVRITARMAALKSRCLRVKWKSGR